MGERIGDLVLRVGIVLVTLAGGALLLPTWFGLAPPDDKWLSQAVQFLKQYLSR